MTAATSGAQAWIMQAATL